MSKNYDVEIEGSIFRVTTDARQLDVIVDGVPYTLTFESGRASSTRGATRNEGIEALDNSPSVMSICVVCNGEVVCDHGNCVETECGTFCR